MSRAGTALVAAEGDGEAGSSAASGDLSPRTARIYYLVDKIGTGGTASHLEQVLAHLDRSRFTPAVGCLASRAARSYDPPGFQRNLERYRELGAEVDLFELECVYHPRYLGEWLRLARVLVERKTDLLHTYLFSSSLVGPVLGALTGVQATFGSRREEATWMSPRHRIAARTTDSMSRYIITVTEEVARQVRESGVERSRVVVIPNGIDVDAFADLAPPPRPRPPGLRDLGMVANLVPIKGHEVLLQALSRAAPRAPAVRLLLVGDGPLRGELEELTASLGITDRVVFAGRHPASEWLGRFDAGVQASHSEGASNVILEYLAAGLPVIATAVGANAGFLSHGETAWLVPPGEPEPLADAIVSLSANPERARVMAQRGRAFVRRELSARRMVERMEALYDRALGLDQTAAEALS